MKTILERILVTWITPGALALALSFGLPSSSGAQWEWTGGPDGGGVGSLFSHGGYLFASTDSGLFRSTDNGASWIRPDTGQKGLIGVNDFALLGEYIYTDGTWRSSDYGSTWTRMSANRGGWQIAVLGPRIFNATNDGGLSVSTDSGLTWSSIYPGLNDPDHMYAVRSIGKVLYVSGYGVCCSTDSGATWIISPSDSTTSAVVDFAGFETVAFSCGGLGVARTTNSGVRWVSVNHGLPYIDYSTNRLTCIIANGTNLFTCCKSGVFLSTDSGGSWSKQNNGLSELSDTLYPVKLAICGNNLFAGMGKRNASGYMTAGPSGVWRRPLSDFGLSSVENSTITVSSLSLATYPEPATTRTTITFTLPASGTATLTLTDAAGREWPLVGPSWFAAGEHHLTWDASTYPSGVYLCRLIAGERSCSAKIAISH